MAKTEPTLVIVGVGLIGGSIGLGLKRAGWRGIVRGVDRADVLEQALSLRAIDEAVPELDAAIRQADIVVLATPVATILDLLPKVAALAPPDALITDTGSTKRRILAAARQSLGPDVRRRFLGGHPLAGRESGGLAGADARLFAGLPWLLVPPSASATPAGDSSLERLAALGQRHALWLEILTLLGAEPRILDSERHDQAMAWLSHLPQLLSTALGATLYRQFIGHPENEEDLQASGPGLRDMIRLAGSPYPLWRDILLTNSDGIEAALTALQQELDQLRLHLRTREIETLFHEAGEVCGRVRSTRRPRD